MNKYIKVCSFLTLLCITSVMAAVPKDTIKKAYKDSVVISKAELKPGDVRIYFKTDEKKSLTPVVLPIITLLLGIGLNRGWDWLDKKKQTKKQGRRWKTELELLALPMTKEIGFINEFLEAHKAENFSIPDFTISLSLSCTAFEPLDKSELIRYVEIFKSKQYRDAINVASQVDDLINSLKHNYQLLNDKFNDYLSGVSAQTLELNEGLQDIMKYLARYGSDLERDGHNLEDPRYMALLNLFTEEIMPYRENANYDPFRLHSVFLPQFFSITSHLRTDQRIIPMLDAARKINISIQKLKNEKFYIETNLVTIMERYTKYQIKLETVLKDL